MDRTHILLFALIAAVLAVTLLMVRRPSSEPFASSGTDAKADCPTEAARGPDGQIHVKPGNRTFATLADYVGYLGNLYEKGAKCIPPMVRPNRTPITGILGGLGNGAEPPDVTKRQGTTRDVLDFNNVEETSAKTPIQKLDDYEYTRVFEQERGSRNYLANETKNELLSSRVLDWANLPFNSEDRAEKEDAFVEDRMQNLVQEPKSGVFFSNMEGVRLEPPDVEAAKEREQKILASYRPTDITRHVIDNKMEAVAKLVHDTYKEDKNWEPVVRKTGENSFEVFELIPKRKKESYEDEQTKTLSMMEGDGTAHPTPTIDIDSHNRGDPYFDKAGVGDQDNNRFWNYKDFNKWTPGLERMFAPTMDNKAWF
jgi:hypothetical protein